MIMRPPQQGQGGEDRYFLSSSSWAGGETGEQLAGAIEGGLRAIRRADHSGDAVEPTRQDVGRKPPDELVGSSRPALAKACCCQGSHGTNRIVGAHRLAQCLRHRLRHSCHA